MDSLAGIPVLVTGGSGFIGSHLTRRLIREHTHAACPHQHRVVRFTLFASTTYGRIWASCGEPDQLVGNEAAAGQSAKT